MRWLIAPFLAVSLLACGDDGGSADAGETDPGCSGDDVCAPDVPSQWEGPVAVADASDASSLPDCEMAGLTQFALAGDVSGAPAECDCRCNSSGCTATLTFDNDGNCQNVESQMTNPGECVEVPAGVAAVGVVTEGQCIPEEGEPDLPALSGGPATLVCSGLECSGGVCVAPGDDFRSVACVVRDGDRNCPDGYPEKEVVNQVNDERGCSECSCPGGVNECPGVITLFTDDVCSSVSPGIAPPAEGCVGLNNVDGVRFEPGSEGCPPIGGEPMGEVTAGDELTICCTS